MNYYNENDPAAAAWLRGLIKDGFIPDGVVDDRDIKEVEPADIDGFTQCHFFAGIAGWSEALRLAHWRADRPVWTGSVPCQPLSLAGAGKGHADERHLWPDFARLISIAQPAIIFGEQVASELGREWFSGVRIDLAQMGYITGASGIPACSIGAPHFRQRIYWVGYTSRKRLEGHSKHGNHCEESRRHQAREVGSTATAGSTCGMADCHCNGCDKGRECFDASRHDGAVGNSPWSGARIIKCKDGKFRRIPIEPAFHPMAYGFPGRVEQLRGYGNAIVPQVGAAFIKTFMQWEREHHGE